MMDIDRVHCGMIHLVMMYFANVFIIIWIFHYFFIVLWTVKRCLI